MPDLIDPSYDELEKLIGHLVRITFENGARVTGTVAAVASSELDGLTISIAHSADAGYRVAAIAYIRELS